MFVIRSVQQSVREISQAGWMRPTGNNCTVYGFRSLPSQCGALHGRRRRRCAVQLRSAACAVNRHVNEIYSLLMKR